ncbi:hypothetical protein [Legionella fallonii]|uniref:Uncharacterized protein n=1 Tax=Legionella fallonii LLAP-10 TaxID=1212491 RepID=A0A098G4U6_9GAMM|nr:hypothetical protein [Legionella fallonii]CEG57487.1 conserved protein of unknown function [Legionella fallonii LLAP-10]
MPQKGRELPEVTDHLDDFVEKLLTRVADESEEGRAALIVSMEAAQKIYNEPAESWFYGWFYQYTRTRGPEIDTAISSIKAFPEAYIRLQEIKILVSKGEWLPDSSYNYYLFVELIRSVPGYKPLEAELMHPITIKVKNKILDKIDNFMYQYQATQKAVAERNNELASTHRSAPKKSINVDNVLLFNNVRDAQVSAKHNIEKRHFSLVLTEGNWVISWVDLGGRAHDLDVYGKELIALLVEHKVNDVDQANEILAKLIKNECVKARDHFLKEGSFLKKAELMVNPKKNATHEAISNSALIDKGTTATFVLRGKPHGYSLTWINHVGNVKTISLDAYPQLKKWLDLQNPLSEEKYPELKAYLLQISTTSAMAGMDFFKKELMSCLAKGPKKSGHPPKPTTTVNKLDLTRFAELERCLETRQAPSQSTVPVEANMLDVPEVPEDASVATVSEEPASSLDIPSAPKARLNLSNYAAVTQLFGHQPKLEEGTSSVDGSEQGFQLHRR